jgi:hypothetical protein
LQKVIILTSITKCWYIGFAIGTMASRFFLEGFA